MRIDASATAITWLPFDALDRMQVIPLELAVAHYDEPPPVVVPDLDELRRRDAFREANEVSAWIEIEGGTIVDYGQSGRSLIGEGPELEVQQVSFAAVEFPVIQPEPEVGDGRVRFTQTVGGRIGLPAPRRVVASRSGRERSPRNISGIWAIAPAFSLCPRRAEVLDCTDFPDMVAARHEFQTCRKCPKKS